MKTSICAIIKDEHLFLKEWIDWHLGLGFDAIHLFEDKGSKSHEEICKKYSNVFLRKYEDDGEVQDILSAQGTSYRQQILYTWFVEKYKNTYDWTAFIDLDEFIVFSDDYNLNTLCKEFENYPAVYLNWKMMGASGHINRPTCGVMEAYTKECEFPGNDKMWAQKSFVNLKNFKGFKDLHRAIEAVNTNHSLNMHELCYDKVSLNHYFTKSWEDWCDRIFNRGGTLNGHRTLAQFFECNPSMEYLRKDLIDSVSHRIPKGTYWLDKKNCFIAGGNVNKIIELNGEKIIKPIDIAEKKILLIGNKPVEKLTDERIAKINSYDIIVRCNGMNNKSVTGNRVDWWWLNVWDWDEIKENLQKSKTDYSNVDVIMIDSNSEKLVNERSLYMNLPKMTTNKTIVYTKQSSTKLYDQDEYWVVDRSYTVPTTDVVCLSYLLNKYVFSEITVTCLDIEDREELFKTHPNWKDTWHKNVGGLERDYIMSKVAEGKLKLLEL